jgi:hypothetical protein
VGRRVIVRLFHDHGTVKGVRGQGRASAALYPPRKDPVPLVQKAGLVPWSVWEGAENHALTGIRSPDRPAFSQPLFGLSYSAYKI